MDQIELLKNYLYYIGLYAKEKAFQKQLYKKYKYKKYYKYNSLTSWIKYPSMVWHAVRINESLTAFLEDSFVAFLVKFSVTFFSAPFSCNFLCTLV